MVGSPGAIPGELAEPVTFVVALDGLLRLARRSSEHVACAEGHDVLAAGEMTFAAEPGWHVTEVTNQSTGYCPDPDCWPAVAGALDRVGVPHPGGFTDLVIFRTRTSPAPYVTTPCPRSGTSRPADGIRICRRSRRLLVGEEASECRASR
jgi:hypothetical protein